MGTTVGFTSELSELSEDQAHVVIHTLMNRFGWVGTWFQRGDAESVADRELTDEEWSAVQDTWHWHKGIAEAMSRAGFDAVYEAVHEAGIRPEYEDDPDEVGAE